MNKYIVKQDICINDSYSEYINGFGLCLDANYIPINEHRLIVEEGTELDKFQVESLISHGLVVVETSEDFDFYFAIKELTKER